MTETVAVNRWRAQRKNRAQTRMEITGNGTAIYHRPGGFTKFEFEDKIMRWATSEWVSQDFLDLLANERNVEKRAPLGDSHGAWQKVAEVPTTMLFDKVPPDALEDNKAINRWLNDPDMRAFRTDGAHRVA
jgi:hypothetical protein